MARYFAWAFAVFILAVVASAGANAASYVGEDRAQLSAASSNDSPAFGTAPMGIEAAPDEPCHCCLQVSCNSYAVKLPTIASISFGLPQSDTNAGLGDRRIPSAVSLGVPTPPPKSA